MRRHPPPKEPRSGNGTVVSTCTGWDHGRGGVVGSGRGPGSLVVACGWLVRPPGAVRSPPGLLVGRSPSQDGTERSYDRPHEREHDEPDQEDDREQVEGSWHDRLAARGRITGRAAIAPRPDPDARRHDECGHRVPHQRVGHRAPMSPSIPHGG